MSLDADIGNLIASSQQLIDTFEGKKTEIDNRIAQAIPSSVSQLNQIIAPRFWVDAVNGDDANPGTSSTTPVKTLDSLSSKMPDSGRVTIYLKENQTHQFKTLRGLETGHYFITRYGDNGNNATLQCLPTELNSGAHIVEGIELQQGNIIFHRVDLLCEYTGSETLDNNSGLVRYSNCAINVIVYQGKVTLNGYALSLSYPGYSGINMYLTFTAIDRKAATANNKMIKNVAGVPPAYILNVHGGSLEGESATFDQLVPVNADRSNVLSNITI